MIENKFRCWDVENKKMYPVAFPTWNGMIETRTGSDSQTFFLSQCGPEMQGILLRFIGLLDKNDVEIYQGDIIKLYQNSYGPFIREVSWSKENHGFFPFCGDLFLNWRSQIKFETLEVIGNIYENPELLKEKK